MTSSQRSERVRVALKEVRQWSGGLPGGPGRFEGPPRVTGEVERPSHRSGRHSQRFGRGRDAFPQVHEGSAGPF